MSEDRIAALRAAASERIVILDGAWATEIQARGLTEEQARGERFAQHPLPLLGNHDVLCLTMPDLVRELIDAQFGAGTEIISTNTFSSTSIAQRDYGLEDHVGDINHAAAAIAREAADTWTQATGRMRWVAGAIGPTNITLSMSADVEDPGARAAIFDELYEAYKEQARALIDADVDLLLLETVFDTLNAKAAIKAALDVSTEQVVHLGDWGLVADG